MLSVKKLSDMKLGMEYQFIIEMFLMLNDFPVFSHNKQTNEQKNKTPRGSGGDSPVVKNTKHQKVNDRITDNRSCL